MQSYSMDEEELAKEIYVDDTNQNKKKRKYKTPTLSPPKEGMEQKREKKIPLPPPVYISNIEDLNVFKYGLS